MGYVWVREYQKRGSAHYHVLWRMPKGLVMPKADERGWWREGWTGTERVRSAVAYLMKYCQKEDVLRKGKGRRMWGDGGLNDAGRAWVRYQSKPAYVRECCEPQDRPRRSKGGGYTVGRLCIPTEWVVNHYAGGMVGLRKLTPDESHHRELAWEREGERVRQYMAQRVEAWEAERAAEWELAARAADQPGSAGPVSGRWFRESCAAYEKRISVGQGNPRSGQECPNINNAVQ